MQRHPREAQTSSASGSPAVTKGGGTAITRGGRATGYTTPRNGSAESGVPEWAARLKYLSRDALVEFEMTLEERPKGRS